MCNRGGIGDLRQINTCRQVPFLVDFKEKPTFRVWCLTRYLVPWVQVTQGSVANLSLLQVQIIDRPLDEALGQVLGHVRRVDLCADVGRVDG